MPVSQPEQVAKTAMASSWTAPWLNLSQSQKYFEDDDLAAFSNRATQYVEAGLCVNLVGTAGLGKTTMAFRLAENRGRPVSFMAGNEWLTSQDFIGREVGHSERSTIDKYVHSVRRTETVTTRDWKYAILAESMQKGYTLIYDEFTRASPEANSTLLSVLEEGILVMTDQIAGSSYIQAHQDFRIIMTSNPHDYVGVRDAPDALMDRIISLEMPKPQISTLSGIVAIRTGLDIRQAQMIVQLVSSILEEKANRMVSPLRTAIMAGRVASYYKQRGHLSQNVLAQILADVLNGRGVPITATELLAHLSIQQAAS